MRKKRTEAQRQAWLSLSPFLRYFSVHRESQFHEDESLERETMADLETGLGLQQWDATLASRTEIDKDDDNLKGDYYPMSFQEIAEVMGITRERVRQIEARALQKLRHPSNSKHLRDFMD